MSKLKKVILIVMILGTIIVFVESLMPYSVSKNQSDTVGGFIGGVVETEEEQDAFNFFIRKLIGHFGGFLCLGICVMSFFGLKNRKIEKAYLITLIYGGVVSIISELLQLIPKGRVCSNGDMVLNFFGFMIGSFLVFIVLFTIVIFKRMKGSEISA